MSITLSVGVKVLLKNSVGKYLLLKRSAKKYIDPGTPLLENLKREVREETGLILTSTPRLIAAQDILKNPEKHIVRLTYLAETEGEPMLNNQEHNQYKWLTLEEIKKLTGLDSYFKQILEGLV